MAVRILGRRIASGVDPSDLAVDVECDPTTAAYLQQLHAQKLQAVRNEDYDEAQRLKQQITALRGIGYELAALEVKKADAVEMEDYELAKRIKVKMDELRRQHAPQYKPPPAHHHHQQQQQQSVHQAQQLQRVPSWHRQPSPSPQPGSVSRPPSAQPRYEPHHADVIPYDERPLPALKSHPDDPEETANPFGDRYVDRGCYRVPPLIALCEPRAGSVHINAAADVPSSSSATGDVSDPPALSEANRAAFADLIGVFGEACIALFCSKMFQHRVSALDEIEAAVMASGANQLNRAVQPLSTGAPADAEYINLVRHALQAVSIALGDSICQVCVRAMCLIETVIETAFPSMDISDIQNVFDPVVPTLVNIMDLNSGRAREKARRIFGTLIDYPAVIGRFLSKPLRNSNVPKPLQTRVELLTILIESNGLSEENGIRLEPIVQYFVLPALRHRQSSVRQAGANLAVALHSRVGATLLPFLEGVMNPKLEAALFKTIRDRQQHHQQSSKGKLSTPFPSHTPVPALASLSPVTIHNRRGSPPQRQRESFGRRSPGAFSVPDDDANVHDAPNGYDGT